MVKKSISSIRFQIGLLFALISILVLVVTTSAGGNDFISLVSGLAGANAIVVVVRLAE